MVTAGHYLATASGYRILEQGGNATDAGVAAGITLNFTFDELSPALGIDPGRITTVSYGKERPAALGSDEAAWAQNRRAVTVTIQY